MTGGAPSFHGPLADTVFEQAATGHHPRYADEVATAALTAALAGPAADERVVSSTAAGAAWLGSCAVRRTMAGLEAPVAGTSGVSDGRVSPPPSSSLFSGILQPGAGTRRMRSAATAPAERLAAL